MKGKNLKRQWRAAREWGSDLSLKAWARTWTTLLEPKMRQECEAWLSRKKNNA